jgi:hypothetical protein
MFDSENSNTPLPCTHNATAVGSLIAAAIAAGPLVLLQVFTSPGTNVMIFDIFLPKQIGENIGVLSQNKAKLCKNFYHNIGL